MKKYFVKSFHCYSRGFATFHKNEDTLFLDASTGSNQGDRWYLTDIPLNRIAVLEKISHPLIPALFYCKVESGGKDTNRSRSTPKSHAEEYRLLEHLWVNILSTEGLLKEDDLDSLLGYEDLFEKVTHRTGWNYYWFHSRCAPRDFGVKDPYHGWVFGCAQNLLDPIVGSNYESCKVGLTREEVFEEVVWKNFEFNESTGILYVQIENKGKFIGEDRKNIKFKTEVLAPLGVKKIILK
jgi:hypothetical protein